jgi:hypothetical protein
MVFNLRFKLKVYLDDVFTGLPVYDISDINLIQEIGKGGFGVVFR